MKSFRDIIAWQKAMDLVDAVYDLVRTFPPEEKYALGDQLRRAVVSIPSNIAEGFGRDTHKDFAHFIYQARGSLYEVDTQLEIAVRRHYVESIAREVILMNEIAGMLGALARKLRTNPTPGAKCSEVQSA